MEAGVQRAKRLRIRAAGINRRLSLRESGGPFLTDCSANAAFVCFAETLLSRSERRLCERRTMKRRYGAPMSSTFDPLIDRPPARYVVGIDLGTTNSAVAYVDTQESPWQVRVLLIPQLVASGVVESRDTLPSFHYEAATGEAAGGLLRLPWDKSEPNVAVGVYARDHGGRNPGRQITSAKSWLCHSGVDRTADLLPWHGADDVERLSPIEVSARILRHVASAWNAQFRSAPLADQDVVLTLPASFDEIAQGIDGRSGGSSRTSTRGLARGTASRLLCLGLQACSRPGTTWSNLGRRFWCATLVAARRILP